MPELPEVETVARDLRGAVTGRRIEGVTVIRPDVVRYPDGSMLPALLTGQRFAAVEIPNSEKAPIIRNYLKRFGFEVGTFFRGVKADSPEEELSRIAPDHPVFRIEPTG